jgi:nitric oxide reductase activation protein
MNNHQLQQLKKMLEVRRKELRVSIGYQLQYARQRSLKRMCWIEQRAHTTSEQSSNEALKSSDCLGWSRPL